MARYTGPVCRLCRREGVKLYLKGDRCKSGKCSLDRRSTVPGQHGAAQKKPRAYGIQLREKQKTRRYYGVLEKQFVNYFVEADRRQGMTGENLLGLIERRLDNVVYEMGFASSRKEARQLVLHGHFTLNGKNVNIPSLLVKAGDVIAVKERSRASAKFVALAEVLGDKIVPQWIEVNAENLSGKIVALPTRDDVQFPFNEQLIVELYSK
ncbi:MAG: 30S ribosomal protein S4 [Clostridia bacterium]|nr:30S ribosomal protein S4 [Clostridia bacterium]